MVVWLIKNSSIDIVVKNYYNLIKGDYMKKYEKKIKDYSYFWFKGVKFSKEFYEFNLEKKLAYVRENPESIFLIDKNIIPDSIDPSSDMYKLKLTALRHNGSILLHFDDAGLSYDKNLVFFATRNYPDLIKFLDEKYINEDVCKIAIKNNMALAMYIPVKLMTPSLYSFCNRYIRNSIRKNPKLFWKLPPIMQEMSFSACSVYLDKDFNFVKRLTREQLNLNNGKILYKIARKDPKEILKLEQAVWRKNLIKIVVSTQPELYFQLPKKYQDDTLIQFYTYKAVLSQNKMEIFEHIFTPSIKQKLDKKLSAIAKRKGVSVEEVLEIQK